MLWRERVGRMRWGMKEILEGIGRLLIDRACCIMYNIGIIVRKTNYDVYGGQREEDTFLIVR